MCASETYITTLHNLQSCVKLSVYREQHGLFCSQQSLPTSRNDDSTHNNKWARLASG